MRDGLHLVKDTLKNPGELLRSASWREKPIRRQNHLAWLTCIAVIISFLWLLRVSMAQAAVGVGRADLRPAVEAESSVPRYGLFEAEVVNTNFYSNPFDFNEIELRATFEHPASAETVDFYGFYDGDGQGGQDGDIWKLRFMPNRTGTWNYSYSWSDGTPGGSGSFEAVAGGLAGPIMEDASNPSLWITVGEGSLLPYYINAERPFNVIGHPSQDAYLDYIANTLGAKGVAAILHNQVWLDCQDNSSCSPSDPTFALANWAELDIYLQELRQRDMGINIMFYSDDAAQPRFSGQSDFEKLLLKYTIARLGAYPFITFDSGIDILEYRSSSWSDWFAQELLRLDPWDHPVASRHGGGSGNFSCSNCTYDSRGDRHPDYSTILNVMQSTLRPVFFTDRWREDYSRGDFDSDSIRRIMWHAAVAGGAGFMIGGKDAELSLSDYENDLDAPQQLKAFSDFWHTDIGNWSDFEVCNSLLSSGYCFGESGQTYVIYLETSEPTTVDLSGVSGSYAVEWFNPRSGSYTSGGAVSGGSEVTLSPPVNDGEDWVLRLGSTPVAPGDLNADGVVDVLDVQLCVNVFLGTETRSEIVARADVNNDNTVDVLDVQMIVNTILSD